MHIDTSVSIFNSTELKLLTRKRVYKVFEGPCSYQDYQIRSLRAQNIASYITWCLIQEPGRRKFCLVSHISALCRFS